jgi:hypothetical protein
VLQRSCVFITNRACDIDSDRRTIAARTCHATQTIVVAGGLPPAPHPMLMLAGSRLETLTWLGRCHLADVQLTQPSAIHCGGSCVGVVKGSGGGKSACVIAALGRHSNVHETSHVRVKTTFKTAAACPERVLAITACNDERFAPHSQDGANNQTDSQSHDGSANSKFKTQQQTGTHQGL